MSSKSDDAVQVRSLGGKSGSEVEEGGDLRTSSWRFGGVGTKVPVVGCGMWMLIWMWRCGLDVD